MRRLISILSLAALWQFGAAWAQLVPPNEMGVTWGHVHLNAPPELRNKETKSWLALGGQLGNNLTEHNVPIAFPGIVLLLGQNQSEISGGSEGSVVDHVAFKVPNLEASMAKWKAANWGLKEHPSTRPGQGFLTTPAGVKVEILEDKTLQVPIAFDHVHFYVPESGLKEMENYYSKMFGARPVTGESNTYSLPGGKLVFSKSSTPTVPPTGRALDHIGFEIAGSHTGLETFSKALEAKGVKFRSTYRKSELGNARPMDPFGVMTELTHGLNGYADFKHIEEAISPCENRSAKCW